MASLNDNTIEVSTGEVKAALAPVRLRASALGSCVAVMLYDAEIRAGGMAHVMLPSADLYLTGEDLLKYAKYAIENLIKKLLEFGAAKEKLTAKITGGAMIIKDTVDIGIENIKAVEKKLEEEGIPILGKRVGGNKQRGVILDTATGIAWYSEGGEVEKAL